MFIVALFTITKTWKQPQCPLTDEWIKKIWYMYTVEYYSAIKKNEIMPFVTTWMDLEIIVLSEVAAAAKSLQSCPTLCDHIDGSPPGSPVPGILQARILEWVAMPSSRGSARCKDQNQVSHITGGFFTVLANREAQKYWSG